MRFKIIFLSLLSITTLAIWRSGVPFPNDLNWDLFAHQALFNALTDGGWSLILSQISDGFHINAYTPLFALLLGLGRRGVWFLSLPAYYYLLNTLHFFSTVVLSFYTAQTVTKSKTVAVISTILGALTFESVTAQTTFFFLPQTLAATLVVLALLFQQKKKLKKSILLLAVAFPLHFVIGGLGWGLFTLVVLLNRLKIKRDLILVATGGLFLLSLASNLFVQPIFTLTYKFSLLRKWYGLVWLFFPVGIWWVLRQKGRNLKTVGIISLILLSLVVFPAPYTLKFQTVGRYFIHIIIAVGLSFFLVNVKNRWLRIGLVGVFFLSQLFVFYSNQAEFKEFNRYSSIATTLSQDEFAAAKFLREKYSSQKDVLLVSDPATQHILEGLGGVNTPGGNFPTQETRGLVDSLRSNKNPVEIAETLGQVRDGRLPEKPVKTLFVVSGRFLSWQDAPKEKRYNDAFTIWAAKDLPPKGIWFANRLAGSSAFGEVFRNRAMVVFEVN